MDAVKYLKEKQRMLNSLGRTSGTCLGVYCGVCPFSERKNEKHVCCGEFEFDYPEEAIEIVEKWSLEHPQKTILMDFLKKYPNAPIEQRTGLPKFCNYGLGYELPEKCDYGKCTECWNRPLKG